ncbi:DUF6931 family protein [Thaumasiovibrio subtropicus]|uniref:DUF6931 family protein n=1 Tax=Thaumasiovibrio subtropicus TaxID=1891207 RepID=UPI000B35E958|nr:Twin-arginine translocation pathway signal [Thaumasiovibrio subtropicus]
MSFVKIPYNNASDILALYDPSAELKALVEPNMSPAALVTRACDEERFSDAVIFLAHGMPVREAIWWSCCCASHRTDWKDVELDAIRSAKAWVHAPDETSRRYAEKAANAATLDTGAGWTAQAAFWSGGSITDDGAPPLPAPPYLYAHAVGGAINLTAVLPDGAEVEKRYPLFIEIGIHIANGGNGQIEGVR